MSIIGLIGGYLLLVPPVVGLANQSDFSRLMDPFGIAYPPNLTPAEHYWCFTDVHFILTKPQPLHYFSSQFIFVGAAWLLNYLITKGTAFDIRFLSVLELTALLFLLWEVGRLLQKIAGRRLAIGLILAAIIVTDVRYLAYFNTFYTEPATLIFGLAFVVCLFRCLEKPSWKGVVLLTISSVLLISSKPQHATLAIVIGVGLAILTTLNSEWRKLSKFCWPAAAAVFVAGAAVYNVTPAPIRASALYNSVFGGLLLESDNPGGDLAAMGISPAAKVYRGTNDFLPTDKRAGPALFPGGATTAKLVKFYLLRPRYLARRTARTFEVSRMSNEILDLGTFQRGYGFACQSRTGTFSLWDSARSGLFGYLPVMAGFFVVTLSVALFLVCRRGNVRAAGYTILAVMAIVSFYTAAIGDVIDTRRHLVLFHFLFDCCLCCAILYVIDRPWPPWVGRKWARMVGTGRVHLP